MSKSISRVVLGVCAVAVILSVAGAPAQAVQSSVAAALPVMKVSPSPPGTTSGHSGSIVSSVHK